MGLGDILGSISPAFGMLGGKGLFGKLPLNAIGQSGLGGLLGLLLSHGNQGGAPQAPSPVGIAGGASPPGGMQAPQDFGASPVGGMQDGGSSFGQPSNDGGLAALLMHLGIH